MVRGGGLFPVESSSSSSSSQNNAQTSQRIDTSNKTVQSDNDHQSTHSLKSTNISNLSPHRFALSQLALGGTSESTTAAQQAKTQNPVQEPSARQRMAPVVTETAETLTSDTRAAHSPLHKKPRGKCLTHPARPVANDGHDNSEGNLILFENDVISVSRDEIFPLSDKPQPILDFQHADFTLQRRLGQGTFAQVFQCTHAQTGKALAIKIVKNKPAYTRQATVEIEVFRALEKEDADSNFDCDGQSSEQTRIRDSMVLLQCYFMHQNHLCLIFELLGVNLYEVLKKGRFCGLPLASVRNLMKQAVIGVDKLTKSDIIHCDLKPENILLVPDHTTDNKRQSKPTDESNLTESQTIKLIDFGSACFQRKTAHTYIQSRFYRSPEVLLGLPYDPAIDMWSLGCVAAELFLGLPILPGINEHDQLRRICDMISNPPDWMLLKGIKAANHFVRCTKESACNHSVRVPVVTPETVGRPNQLDWRIRTTEEYIKSLSRNEIRKRGGLVKLRKKPGKSYFGGKTLAEIIVRKGHIGVLEEKETLELFVHFLYGTLLLKSLSFAGCSDSFHCPTGLLDPDPWTRWTAKQARHHPFLVGGPVTRQCERPATTRDESTENLANIVCDIYWEAPVDEGLVPRKKRTIKKMGENGVQVIWDPDGISRSNVSPSSSSKNEPINASRDEPVNWRQNWAAKTFMQEQSIKPTTSSISEFASEVQHPVANGIASAALDRNQPTALPFNYFDDSFMPTNVPEYGGEHDFANALQRPGILPMGDPMLSSLDVSVAYLQQQQRDALALLIAGTNLNSLQGSLLQHGVSSSGRWPPVGPSLASIQNEQAASLLMASANPFRQQSSMLSGEGSRGSLSQPTLYAAGVQGIVPPMESSNNFLPHQNNAVLSSLDANLLQAAYAQGLPLSSLPFNDSQYLSLFGNTHSQQNQLNDALMQQRLALQEQQQLLLAIQQQQQLEKLRLHLGSSGHDLPSSAAASRQKDSTRSSLQL